MGNQPTFKDSEGHVHILREKSTNPRGIMESPWDCQECGQPANSPAHKRYCWDCYDKHTNGKVFD